eukprot:CAMPEP_0184987492 /NCGR_PEP_ID=MMETSP1098-20130426/21089_1 /TAXON_ID=89044 /ORGANISM="Spumella elongata, Strain CCAP 955/1" /LENGTH=47 /DNA_ID= /DNA_START= /DNA_END= /DNA_ORIENTATION=
MQRKGHEVDHTSNVILQRTLQRGKGQGVQLPQKATHPSVERVLGYGA